MTQDEEREAYRECSIGAGPWLMNGRSSRSSGWPLKSIAYSFYSYLF